MEKANEAVLAARREKKRAYDAKWDAAHPERKRAAWAKWDAANPEKKRAYNAKYRADPVNRARHKALCRERNCLRNYGITHSEKMKLLAQQGGACVVCGATEPTTRHPWHLDHDHKTGRIRGVLCHYCNVAAGAVRDSPATADALATYLRKHQ